ncbi:hypothetical protein NK6_4110 [Bradyrhizobium diazoefficiens]|uniref:Uncharacterized protein n=1 Tax=Bradyrhizobium diazoefficiens TaxID=1355477 RepID=A0A0E4BPZ3_9BRAD|nr:hypothetical protein NK6_4110 [Bradyrhizobium diazoefficiens]
MIIYDLNVIRFAISPNKANSELFVDPNRVLSFAIFFQFMKLVVWRCFQIE